MTDLPEYANGGLVHTGEFVTSTTDYPETIVSACGYPWGKTEPEDEQRE
ncbi:hypothetical protein [Nocardia thailandica]|nr:hypothetical protein [Nocardia thailandica]